MESSNGGRGRRHYPEYNIQLISGKSGTAKDRLCSWSWLLMVKVDKEMKMESSFGVREKSFWRWRAQTSTLEHKSHDC